MRYKTIREKYVDLRFGLTAIAPIFSFGTFIMLAHSVILNESIPLILFAPASGVLFLTVFTLIGTAFRKKQLKVDSTLNYEQQPAPCKTTRIMFDDLHRIQKHLNIEISSDSIAQREYMKKIEDSKT